MQLLHMQVLGAICLLLLVGASGEGGASRARRETQHAAVSPVQKVIQMLTGMLAKGQEEKHSEQVQFAAYKQFCEDTSQEKARAVAKADESITVLGANIQLAKTAADDLSREVTKHDNDIATWAADLKAGQAVRTKEAADYSEAHKDYTETVDAITSAVQVLKAQAAKGSRQQAAPLGDLLQLDRIPEANKNIILAFLAEGQAQRQDPTDQLSGSESEAYAYEFRSGSVVDMLNQLQGKFVDERTALEKEELNRRHAHELYMQDVQKSIANAQEARSTKTQERAKSLQRAAEMAGQLTDTQSTRVDDAKYLSEMTAMCRKKADDFGERQNLRAEEIKALGTAISILSSGKVLGASEAHLTLVQRARSEVALSLVLLVNDNENSLPNKLRAAAFLNDRAAHFGNQALAMLALRAQADPFDKVKKMIQDLIMRLQEQAGEEAQHTAWCTAELRDNDRVRTSRTTAIERLQAEIDEKKAQIAKLQADISEFTNQLAESTKAASEVIALRQKEKAANEKAIQDATEAQAAVGQAVAVLREFYATSGQATALVQGSSRKQESEEAATPPPIFDSPYQGMGTENGGVVAMLEVIQSDFARLESETQAAEAVAKTEFNRQQTDAAVLKVQLEKDIEHKGSMRQAAEQALVDLNNDLLTSQKELDAAVTYYDKLKPSCISPGDTFAERAEKRKEEIESLQEALRILNGEDLAML